MKVLCLYNTGENLSKKFLDNGYQKELEMNLVVHKEYIVYGMSIFKENICKYLLVDKYNKSFWYPDEIFQISDHKLSSYWYYKKKEPNEYFKWDWYTWGYYELVNYDQHHDDLIERIPEALEIFNIRKKEMDMEFPDWCIKVTGQIIDSKTLKCPICDTIWESNSIFGMVECPKCKNIMHNPRYEK